MNYEFHPMAEDEHLEIIIYYESKVVGLGALYFKEFENLMKTICETPKRLPIVKEPSIDKQP